MVVVFRMVSLQMLGMRLWCRWTGCTAAKHPLLAAAVAHVGTVTLN